MELIHARIISKSLHYRMTARIRERFAKQTSSATCAVCHIPSLTPLSMPSPRLPSHLSHKVSLVLIPTVVIQEPIQSIRSKHDKQFHGWPPHINLVYPFLATASGDASEAHDETALETVNPPQSPVISRIRKVTRDIPPFTLLLSANSPGIFLHNKRSATVWLRPLDQGLSTTPLTSSNRGTGNFDLETSCTGPSVALLQLQAALQHEFLGMQCRYATLRASHLDRSGIRCEGCRHPRRRGDEHCRRFPGNEAE